MGTIHPDTGSTGLGRRDAPLRIQRTYAPDGLRLSGELDRDNCAAVRAALAAGVRADGGDLHLDVAGLVFWDVHGMRTVARAAASLPGGGRLVLHGASAPLRTLFELAGWGEVPGLIWAREEER
ncbi:STAS domain-containing protein [Allostreptomyces psammosilenae]|uniref:Anti-anti-sigma regulatory factor n=1 Tax=Allostreptomyces psammosilenae TaxID=1892865 RepID=A0A852ZQY8_9ACTN|nr:STAS domain-containing protein [Allostreptomyces psammosilenae]NYI04165.1 anti-anti-sigma regulatory factor [Allostreptomyces psammosilenae]